MADAAKDDKKNQAIFVKKIIKKGGHHGGAWKVAYADFVTAMMAFFMLLWLLNVTTEEQKKAISNYFDPTHPKVSESMSGAGGVMGGLTMSPQGAMATQVQQVQPTPPSTTVNQRTQQVSNQRQAQNISKSTLEKAKEELRKQEEKKFKEIEKQIRQAIEADPELKALSKNLIIDMTPEGLRIQIVDSEGRPMFASGSAEMFDYTKKLIGMVTRAIMKLPNELSVRGHTDSTPYPGGAKYTNWELSSDRANSTRRELLNYDFPVVRINNVVGKADTDHIKPDKPADPSNRRISLILLKEELTNPNFENKAAEKAKDMPDEPNAAPVNQIPVGTFRRTQGNVEFP
jgi:chemotaxis protein MotB